jgi:hypothetical protein
MLYTSGIRLQTLIKQLKLNSGANNEAEIHEYLDQECKAALSKGDLLGAGEWLASTLDYDCDISTEQAAAHVLALSRQELKNSLQVVPFSKNLTSRRR